MANTKLEKALYGPSMTEVALGAILGVIIGVLVAAVYLVFKPVLTVKQMPKEISRSAVYYVPGSESSAKSKGWQAKQKLFVAGSAFQMSEEELNAWAATLGAPASAAKPADKAKPPGKPKPEDRGGEKSAAAPAAAFLIPSAPNFRVVDGKLQIGLKCTLNYFGLTYDVTVQATGGFRKSGDQLQFEPESVFMGSCPLHLLPAASNALVTTLVAKQKTTDEMRLAWTKLTAVTVEGGVLKFAVQ